jgi:site-specific DNA-methyltransferase (adenine-specific)
MRSTELTLDTVIVGDALNELQKLSDGCIDVTVTSPPYNKKRNTRGWLVQTNRYSHFEDWLPEDEYQARQVAVLNELHRVTRPGGSLFYNHKLRWEQGELLHPYQWITRSNWTVRQEIVWDRTLAANMRGWRFWQVDERIYWLFKPIGDHLVGEELSGFLAKLIQV